MPIHLEIRTISGVLKRGEIVLQQLAHFKHSIFEKASSCRSGRCFSRPRIRLVRSRNCLFSFFFFSASCRQVCSLNCMVDNLLGTKKRKKGGPFRPRRGNQSSLLNKNVFNHNHHKKSACPAFVICIVGTCPFSFLNIPHFVWYASHKGYICRSNNLIR